MNEQESQTHAKIVLEGNPLQAGLALGMAAPLYAPAPGKPLWMDPRLLAEGKTERLTIEYKMQTEPVEVVVFCRAMHDRPPLLAPYVQVVAWVVETLPENLLPAEPVVQVDRLPAMLPSDVPVIVDGYAGLIFIEPDEQTMGRYQARLARVEKRTRYFIEEVHLPAMTRDERRIEVGAWVTQPDEIETALQAGADFLCLDHATTSQMTQEPPSRESLLSRLGGKPLWLIGNLESPAPESVWQLSAHCDLTLLLLLDSDSTPNAQRPTPDLIEAWQRTLQEAWTTLRAQRVEIGRFRTGLAIPGNPVASLSSTETGLFNMGVIAWLLESEAWQAPKAITALMESPLKEGWRYHAVRLPHTDTLFIAKGLGLEAHAFLLLPDQIQAAKETISLLGQEECREWLYGWLRHLRKKAHERQLLEWLEVRKSLV